MSKRSSRRARPLAMAAGAALAWAGVAAAQQGPPPGAAANAGIGLSPAQQYQRQQRFDELQQLQVENRLRANTDIPPEQRALFDYGGYFSFEYLSFDDRSNNNHGLRQGDLVLYGRANLDAANEVFARGRLSYQDFNPGDQFEGSKQGWNAVQFERGYYRFDLAKYDEAYKGRTPPYDVTAQLGRDLVYWANGLVLGQVLDGGIFDLRYQNADLQLVAGVTMPQTVDFDTSRPAFAYNTHRGFYGAMLSYNLNTEHFGQHKPFVYFLSQHDYNTHDTLQQGNLTTHFDYNSYYVGFGSTGSLGGHLVYGAEMAFEGGNTLSNSYSLAGGLNLTPVPQTRNDIEAFAADYRLDYLLNDRRNTRLSAEVILATGDPDRGNSSATFAGNRPNTRDLGFNGFGLINTGLAFAPEVSNLLAFRVGASTYPLIDVPLFRRMQVGTDLFLYDKLRVNGAFDEQTTASRYLGWEPDVYVNWQVTSDVTIALRYGVFVPSSSVVAHDEVRQFLYTGVTLAF